ncbi:MAG: glutamate racemase [Actinomycetaceae bacterium]|nr:glutamate racemase [Actinomycetaceae bacterium]
MNDAPIGIFDSGIGGLTVARSVMDQLPDESIRYIGDTKNTPYGEKPIAKVRQLALEIMDYLVEDEGVKMLVIACNTATAAVLHDARERYTASRHIPVVEVIQPAARAAVRSSRSGKIGVIGTRTTVNSGAYADALGAVPGVELFSQACPRFVEFAEAGISTGPKVLQVARSYLRPLQEAGVDTLILGCTHYPLLQGVISYVMGPKVNLVSSSDECARDVYRELAKNDLLRAHGQRTEHYFSSTGPVEPFRNLAARILGPKVPVVPED